MKITDIISTGTNGISASQNGGEQAEITARITAQLFKELRNLISGQTIQGEVVSRNGDDITLRLDNSLMINAKVASDISLEIGKNVTFEVRNNGKTLTLSPLMTNMSSANPTAVKALNMAEIPLEPRSIAMAENMMKAGMPIDKDSLSEVYKDIVKFPDSSVEDIVDLHLLGVEVSEEDIIQVQSYKELSHYLSDGLGEVATNIADGLEQVIHTISEGNADANTIITAQNLVSVLNEVVAESTIVPDIEPMAIPNANVAASSVVETENAGTETTDMSLITEEKQVAPVEAVAEVAEAHAIGIKTEAEDNEQATESIPDPKATQALKMLGDIEKALEHGDIKQLKDIISRKDSFEIISEGLRSSWSMDSYSAKDRARINQFFRRVLEDFDRIRESTSDNTVLNHNTWGSMNNVNSNIAFLNQVNHMFTYVQLPLKNANGNYNGELYVFTNRKNAASNDGTVTAHIHLDMDHLGPVDVHVSLKQEKVRTDFTVADDDMLSFIEAHMDMLTERLNKRGYSCQAKVEVMPKDEKKEDHTGLRPVLDALNNGSRLLSHFAFDVRA